MRTMIRVTTPDHFHIAILAHEILDCSLEHATTVPQHSSPA